MLDLVELPEALGTPEWCEQNIYLSTRIPTSDPGQWRRGNVSALCRPGGPVEAMDDPSVETIVIEKGSQTALTTTVLCWLAKELATDPSSALVVMNSAVDAKEKSAETWRPLWEDSHGLKRYLPTCRRKEWTKLYQLINGSPVYWIGANSAGRLGAKPIRRLVLDEVEKYPRQTGNEAGAAALARQRTKGFRKKGLAKIVEFSTPTDEHGEIHLEFLNGDQRQLYVRCWSCGAEQVMAWSAFKIDMTVAKTDPIAAVNNASYECQHCKAKWTDGQRWSAIDAGEWRAGAQPRDPKCRSYRNPSWNSYFVTVKYLAAQWLKAQTSTSALQDFINSECAEPFVHYENMLKDSVFTALEGQYAENALFYDAPAYAANYAEADKTVLMGVDVQKGYFVCVARAFTAGGDSGLITAREVASLFDVDKFAAEHDAKFVFIDQRYRTREIQEWAVEHAGYIPCYGSASRKTKGMFVLQNYDVDEGRARTRGRVIEVIEHDPDQVKELLAAMIQRVSGSRLWLIPAGFSCRQDYVKQMTAERCVNGRWVNPQNKPNHYWDAEALILLGAVRLGWFSAIQPPSEG